MVDVRFTFLYINIQFIDVYDFIQSLLTNRSIEGLKSGISNLVNVQLLSPIIVPNQLMAAFVFFSLVYL